MHPEVLESFNRVTIPAEALARWNGDPQSLQPLGESQNFVYRFQERGTGVPRVLRITHAGHRSPIDIAAELDFLVYLKGEGLSVATAIPSNEGLLVEPVGEEEGEYQAVVFEEATGQEGKWADDASNRRLLGMLGRWMGRLHKLSIRFQPRQVSRFHWFDDRVFQEPERYLTESESQLRTEFAELVQWLNARPATAENYGLVHGDFGPANYRIQAGHIVVFDFDDCFYHWFAFDIAVAILPIRKLPQKLRRPYLDVFLEGYAAEKDLCGDSYREIGWFSRLSAMNRLIFAIRNANEPNPTPQQSRLIARRRQEVLEPIDWCAH